MKYDQTNSEDFNGVADIASRAERDITLAIENLITSIYYTPKYGNIPHEEKARLIQLGVKAAITNTLETSLLINKLSEFR